MKVLMLALILSGCSPLSASSLSSEDGMAPIICVQSARNDLGLQQALELCAGAHSNAYVCYRAAINVVGAQYAMQLCKGA